MATCIDNNNLHNENRVLLYDKRMTYCDSDGDGGAADDDDDDDDEENDYDDVFDDDNATI